MSKKIPIPIFYRITLYLYQGLVIIVLALLAFQLLILNHLIRL